MRKRCKKVLLALTIVITILATIDRMSWIVWKGKVTRCHAGLVQLTEGRQSNGVGDFKQSGFLVIIASPHIEYDHVFLARLSGGPTPTVIYVEPRNCMTVLYRPPSLVWSAPILERVFGMQLSYELAVRLHDAEAACPEGEIPQIALSKVCSQGWIVQPSLSVGKHDLDDLESPSPVIKGKTQ